jgi:hypothetical protein
MYGHSSFNDTRLGFRCKRESHGKFCQDHIQVIGLCFCVIGDSETFGGSEDVPHGCKEAGRRDPYLTSVNSDMLKRT